MLVVKIVIKEVLLVEIIWVCLDQIEVIDEMYYVFLYVVVDEVLVVVVVVDKQVVVGEFLLLVLVGVLLVFKDVFIISDMFIICGLKILEGW